MRTYLDCIPCFFKQALEASKLAGLKPPEQKRILDKLSRTLPDIPLESSPPEMGRIIYRLVREANSNKDPYKQIKQKSNKMAMILYPKLKDKARHSGDRLMTAVELAIAGNIIDYGIKNSLNVNDELNRILNSERKTIRKEDKKFFQYSKFKKALEKAKNVLYLGDNTGETVFDRILIEEIKKIDGDKKITYAVKEKPIINDALAEDAVFCGIDTVAEIVSSGSDAPGTVLSCCSKKFLKLYKKADMVISKGQGNFEALSGEKRRIFFLFMAKCRVVADHIKTIPGTIILKQNR